MTKQLGRRKGHPDVRIGPIKPGSPLYRALEMVAREVVKSLEGTDSQKGVRPSKPRQKA